MKGAEDVERRRQDRFNMILLLLGVAAVLAVIFVSPFIVLHTRNAGILKLLGKVQLLSERLFYIPYSTHSSLFNTLFVVVPVLVWILSFYSPKWRSRTAEQAALWIAAIGPVAAVSAYFLLNDRSFFQVPLRYWALKLSCFGAAAILATLPPLAARKMGPRSVKDLATSPDAFDLEDLSGAAGLKEIEKVLLPGTSESFPTSNTNGRLVLGRFYTPQKKKTNRWVAPFVKDLQQTFVVAPPGSGKTYSIALPWTRGLPLLGHSVFTIDLKGNMLQKLYPGWTPEKELERRNSGKPPVYFFDPSSPEASIRWNPLLELDPKNPVAFSNGRDAIAEAIFGELSSGDNGFFDLRDLRLIRAGIEALYYLDESPSSLADVHELFLDPVQLEADVDALKAHPKADELRDVIATLELPLKSKRHGFEEILQGVHNKLQPFIHAALREVLSTSEDHDGQPFSIARLNKDTPQVFICATPLELGLLGSTVASLMVRSLQQKLLQRFKSTPKTRLFMILDEFSKLRLDHKQVENFVSTSREAGAVSVIFLQDVSQIREEIRAAVLANCQDKYFLHGAGPQTAQWCSKALGDRRRLQSSISENESASTKHQTTGLSRSISESWVPVLRPREISTTGGLKYGAWVVLNHYSHKPMLVDLERPT